jgi:hypothetical protein
VSRADTLARGLVAAEANVETRLRAYKVLSDGRSSFTGSAWPLPAIDRPGGWVRAQTPLGLCRSGIHACTADQLPQWLGAEIWEVELAGEVLHEEPAIVAERARLVRKIDAWDEHARVQFAEACLARVHEITAEYPAGAAFVAKVGHCVSWGGAAPAGYFTAMLAGEFATGQHGGPEFDAAFTRERVLQAAWLKRELQLAL